MYGTRAKYTWGDGEPKDYGFDVYVSEDLTNWSEPISVFENLMIFVANVEYVSLFWAAVRGFSSGLMHGLCTAAVGIGLSFVHKKKKLFVCGTFALLIAAITYHAIYNTLIQSEYQMLGAILPMATYVPVLIVMYGNKIQASTPTIPPSIPPRIRPSSRPRRIWRSSIK